MADTMDVDPPTAAPGEPKGKTKGDDKGDKKRFEVKKVRVLGPGIRICCSSRTTITLMVDMIVERCCSVGMG